jgi:hypothetical protein
MNERFDLSGSSEDRATYARWRRGVMIAYCFIGAMAIAGIVATHSLRLADQLAGN